MYEPNLSDPTLLGSHWQVRWPHDEHCGSSISVTYVTRVLQMLEASRNASHFADTIEFTIFAHASGITCNRVLQSIIEVFQVQLTTCFEGDNRIVFKIRALQSIIESRFEVNNRLLIT